MGHPRGNSETVQDQDPTKILGANSFLVSKSERIRFAMDEKRREMRKWPLEGTRLVIASARSAYAQAVRAIHLISRLWLGGELARQHTTFDIHYFFQPFRMARLRRVPRIQKRANDFKGQFRSDHAGPNAQDIHVIVLDSLTCRVGVVTQTGSDPGKLVRSHADTDSGTANQYPSVDFAVEQFCGDHFREIREIARSRCVRSAVDGIDIEGLQKSGHLILHEKTSMITGDGIAEGLAHRIPRFEKMRRCCEVETRLHFETLGLLDCKGQELFPTSQQNPFSLTHCFVDHRTLFYRL